MFTLKVLFNELRRKKAITAILFCFVFLSAALASAGSSLIYTTVSSVNNLFAAADVPDFMQMHSGQIDLQKLKQWSMKNPLVKNCQAVEMITVDGSYLYLESSRKPLGNGIMDISFVRQNKKFDFLLGDDNKVIAPSAGTIAVPLYYIEKFNIDEGDRITLAYPDFTMSFTVSGFLRDALMNPSIVHSKRFLISDKDYEFLKSRLTETEYLIEFQLVNSERTGDFSTDWKNSSLPKQGPAIDKQLFFVLAAISDGMAGAAVVCMSLLIMLIALLCLRYALIASIEEDVR